MLGSCLDTDVQIDRQRAEGRNSRIFTRGDRIIGCIAINNPREISEAQRVLSADLPLDPLRLGNASLLLSHCAVDQREAISIGQ
ncbi:oxidoreductase C-terminal domain-containing protein [Agrobacterium fabrum]|uniref:oxidoreductase C-terminal domain-containing protein n=1 Tax=Agrobacterium fabrum TaxID=1176649 RepID=UPI00351981D0